MLVRHRLFKLFSSHIKISIAKLRKDTFNGRLDSEDGLATELTEEDTIDDFSICTSSEIEREIPDKQNVTSRQVKHCQGITTCRSDKTQKNLSKIDRLKSTELFQVLQSFYDKLTAEREGWEDTRIGRGVSSIGARQETTLEKSKIQSNRKDYKEHEFPNSVGKLTLSVPADSISSYSA